VATEADTEFSFDEDDLGPVTAAVTSVAATGRGWVNLIPDLEGDQEPPGRNLFAAIFLSRGPTVPLATVAPSGRGDGRLSIGLQHPGGTKAITRLAEHGLELRPGWLKVGDHPKRGMVISTPDDDPEDVIWWLLTAAHLLGSIPLNGSWTARVYDP